MSHSFTIIIRAIRYWVIVLSHLAFLPPTDFIRLILPTASAVNGIPKVALSKFNPAAFNVAQRTTLTPLTRKTLNAGQPVVPGLKIA